MPDRPGPGTTATRTPSYPAASSAPPPPLALPAAPAALRDALAAADYTVDTVIERIGADGQGGLARNHTIPAVRALGAEDDPLTTLIRLFPLQQGSVARSAVERALPGLVNELLDAGILAPTGTPNTVRAAIDIRPYAADDDLAGWVASDLTPGLDTAAAHPGPEHVLGLSPASTTLAQIAVRHPVAAALDLGTGCGVQALHLARHADHVVATDLNARALTMAALTFALNGLTVEGLAGDLFDPVVGRRFDQIISNPPYVMSPPETARLAYRESNRAGDGLVREVVSGAAAHLAPGGTAQLLVNWAHPAGGDWQERIAGWFAGTGCAAHVVQREVLDPAEYVEMWLSDAGLGGSPGYTAAYERWLDYLERSGVAGIGMGWIFLDRTDLADPPIDLEDYPHQVSQPIGDTVAHRSGSLGLRRLDDRALLSSRLVLDPEAVLESLSWPGAADPYRLVLRQPFGFARTVELDTASAGVLGACDGELELGRIIDAVAELLDEDAAALTASLLPTLRRLIRDQLLRSAT